MKLSNPIRICTAVVLLLLFTLQAGLGLYLHNTFHRSFATAQERAKATGLVLSVADDNGFSCSCTDDFLVPFYAAKATLLPQPVVSFFILPQADYYNYLPHSLRIFRSLRAPPVSVS